MIDGFSRALSSISDTIAEIGYNYSSIFDINSSIDSTVQIIIIGIFVGTVGYHLIHNLHQNIMTLLKKVGIALLFGYTLISLGGSFAGNDNKIYIDYDLIDESISSKDSIKVDNQIVQTKSKSITLGGNTMYDFEAYIKPVNVQFKDVYSEDCTSPRNTILWKGGVSVGVCTGSEGEYQIGIDQRTLSNNKNSILIEKVESYVSSVNQKRDSEFSNNLKDQIKFFIEKEYKQDNTLSNIKTIIKNRYSNTDIDVSFIDNFEGKSKEVDNEKELKDYYNTYNNNNIDISVYLQVLDPKTLSIKFGDKQIISYIKVYDLLTKSGNEIFKFLDSDLTFGINTLNIDGKVYLGTSVLRLSIGKQNSAMTVLYPEEYNLLKPKFTGDFFFVGKMWNDIVLKGIVLLFYISSQFALIFITLTLFPLRKEEVGE